MKAVTVIPARYGASRLPGKPLSLIHEKPMIQWVYERCQRAQGISQTLVATDDSRVQKAVEAFGGEVLMTSGEIQSGTDRVAAVATEVEADVFINVQGDEPLIEPKLIETALKLVTSGNYEMATLMTPLKTPDEFASESVVKVWAADDGHARGFSRSAEAHAGTPARHVGLYVYRKETLELLTKLPQTESEKRERLEQLRALENGIRIGLASVKTSSISVDTPEDLEKVRTIMKNNVAEPGNG